MQRLQTAPSASVVSTTAAATGALLGNTVPTTAQGASPLWRFVGPRGGPLEAQIGPITNAHQQQLITAEFRHGQLVIDSAYEDHSESKIPTDHLKAMEAWPAVVRFRKKVVDRAAQRRAPSPLLICCPALKLGDPRLRTKNLCLSQTGPFLNLSL